MHVIQHDDIPADRDAKFVASSTNVRLKRPMRLPQIGDLSTMNCADRDEVERRIVGLENSSKSGRATFDHEVELIAADTAASTPTPKRAWAG